ncbi:MAG: HAMP domain-containing sensor histidine kinase, partial [Gemmatimonadaceae bacterium]
LFVLALLIARKNDALGLADARVTLELTRTIGTIDLVMRGERLPVITQERFGNDSTSFSAAEIDTATAATPKFQRLITHLELAPDYILLADSAGNIIYRSINVRLLSGNDSTRIGAASDSGSFMIAARRLNQDSYGLLTLSNEQVLLRMRRVSIGRVSRVWVGLGADEVQFAPPSLVAVMLIVGPILLGLSLSGAYFIAGRAFKPVDEIIDQVEAISDGRSLHRRVAIGAAGDELFRLSVTLNAMIERLETSFGALRRFTADASHELKTPLTVIRADVERSMSPNSTRHEKEIAMEEALQQVTRMADLVDSLLTLARADEGRFDLHREPVQLLDLTREVVETARLLGEMGGVTIDVPILEFAEIQGDPTRLRQLFLNLVTNAIKYTKSGGRVEITLARAEDQVLFAVRDTGIGIAAADLPYIFERFWRADRARSRASERGGNGLGLAICQWIAHAHGGSLTVESRLGRGSRFVAILPLSPQLGPVVTDA